MWYELILLSLSLNVIESLQRIERVDEQTNNLGILVCVKAIGKRHFLQPQNVEIISLQEPISGFEDFGIVIRSNSSFQYTDFRESLTKYAVIFLDGINYEEDFKMLTILSRSDPQGRFIVSIKNDTDLLNSRKEYVKRIILYLASIERWNVVILINDGGDEITRVYTYTMYSSGNCERVPELVDHGSCADAVTLSNLFPAFVNFRKCPIRLSTMEFPPFSIIREKNGEKQIRGIEANLVKLIVEKLNATYKVFQVSNGTAIRDMVKTRKADLAWSCLLQYKDVETTWSQSYIINKVLFVIPQSRRMPFWMNLILPFQIEVWLALGTMICVHVLIKLLIPWVRRQFPLEWMLSGFFGMGIVNLPTRFSHRIYLISWILVGYVIMQGYSASLTGFFASPGQYKQMQTLDELDKSTIVAAGLRNMKSQLDQTNPRLSRDLKVFSEAEYFENIAKLTAGTGGIASYARADQIQNITHGQESDFIVIPEHINVYPVALLMPNFSSILEGCNRVIHRVCDAGLIEFWMQFFTKEMDRGSRPRDENNVHKTSLTHLGAVFFVLYVGHFFSSIVFAMELILAKFRK